ncbi:EamA family transporter [Kineosporia rhizophila]|uniref:EamA family transporter n=1 Tax=Kineosporia TaxID=49184 RepID=UPI001E42D2A5|nr:EamA family transporter [Kineosporia sp. NBRC 101677]MCE0538495.1 EamA family transporter [Kineosporia rhizophila]GLY18348.1 O-acetylserine/cysteine exporter [Kineosporia sp. NBRC 101677]
MTTRDSLLAVLVTVIWGMNFVVIDEGLAGFPPLLFVALRFVVVLFPAVFLLPRPDLPWSTLLLIGTFLSLGQFALLYASLHAGMPAGLASLVLQTQVVATVVIAAGVLHERPSVRAACGVALGAAGLAVVALGRSAETPLIGLALCVLAALSWAFGNVLSRRAAVKSGLSLTVWSAVVVPVPMIGLSLLLDGPQAVGHALTHITWGNIASTIYTAVLASLVGYGIWNTLLARYQAAQVVPFTLLVPVVGVITAWLVQHERPGPLELLGGLILLLGVAVVAIRRPFARAGERAGEPQPAGVLPEDDAGTQVHPSSARGLTL